MEVKRSLDQQRMSNFAHIVCDSTNKLNKITIFIERLKAIGIQVELFGNYPWIYLDKVNGNKVKEKFDSNHGFTLAYLPARMGQETNFTDITEIFKIIRKYVN